MKKKILAILAGIFVTSAAFALVACSGETYKEPDKAAGNADLVVATVTVLNAKTNRVIFEEKLFSDSGNYLKVPGNINGATFLGYRNATGTEYFDVSGKQDEDLIINKDITLYARYEYEPCKISFNAVGGTLYGGDDTINLYYMDDVPTQFPTAEYEGKIFKGWKDQSGNLVSDGNGTPKYIEFNADNYTIDSNYECKLRAYFEDYYPTVIFDYGDYVESTTVAYKGYVNVPSDNKDNGSRVIVGWSDYANTNPNDATMSYNKPITEDTTIYAIWDTYETVTIELYDENSPNNWIYRGNIKVFKKKDSQFPTTAELYDLCGRDFDGVAWYTDKSQSATNYVESPKQDTSAKTFYGYGYYY